jgi:hypothetical protein
MEFTGVAAHGGDVQMYQVHELPANLKRVETVEGRILARGETSGHCHILTGDVEIFEDEQGNKFAAVGADGAFHQHYKEAMVTPETFQENRNISNCDHTKECRLEPGVYRIGIDRQYDPHDELWQRNLD